MPEGDLSGASAITCSANQCQSDVAIVGKQGRTPNNILTISQQFLSKSHKVVICQFKSLFWSNQYQLPVFNKILNILGQWWVATVVNLFARSNYCKSCKYRQLVTAEEGQTKLSSGVSCMFENDCKRQ